MQGGGLSGESMHTPGITKVAEILVTDNACTWWDDRYGDAYLNAVSFNQDSLLTCNGFQYAVYYNRERYVTVSRRRLSGQRWEHCTLTDYKQSTDDNHNTLSMGISPADGRIHLAFDHHMSTLHYRKSVPGLAHDPARFSWKPSRFCAVESALGKNTVSHFTYPAFIPAPDNTLLFAGRIGTSGNGDNHLWRYNNDGSWTPLGAFITGNGESAYCHGLCYGPDNRLHTTWCWRATSDGASNHDLMYAYSDDHGATWKNNNGAAAGITGGSPINHLKNCKVRSIAPGCGLINQEGMVIDAQNRVHVISREDEAGTNYQIHYWRDTNAVWHRINTGIATQIWDNRSKIAYDNAGNLYAVLPDIRIACAAASSHYSDWVVLLDGDHGRFHHSEPLIDSLALRTGDNALYVFAQAGTTKSVSSHIYVMQYTMTGTTRSPHTRLFTGEA